MHTQQGDTLCKLWNTWSRNGQRLHGFPVDQGSFELQAKASLHRLTVPLSPAIGSHSEITSSRRHCKGQGNTDRVHFIPQYFKGKWKWKWDPSSYLCSQCEQWCCEIFLTVHSAPQARGAQNVHWQSQWAAGFCWCTTALGQLGRVSWGITN